MRRESRQTITVQLARVQRYHEGGSYTDAEAYTRAGYNGGKFRLRTSDRWIDFAPDGRNLVTGKPGKGYGLEIETECRGITIESILANVLEKIVFPAFPEGLFKLQHDGSLGGQTSAECITQPMTKEAVRNLYPAFKAMYNDYFPAFGISCAASGNCGMHVNISTACFGITEEAQAEAIRKLYYIINHHFRLFANLLNRDPDNTTYCAQMDASRARTMSLSGRGSDHYCSFNLGHYDAGRIELRLVGGQKDYAAFRNTMETVFHLVERVKKISWKQLDDVAAIFAGCNQYVADRVKSHGYGRGLVTREQWEAIQLDVKPETLL